MNRPPTFGEAFSEWVVESWSDFARSEVRGPSLGRGRRRNYGTRKPFTRAELDDAVARCMDLAEGSSSYDGNAYCIGAVHNRRNYIVGRDGFGVKAESAPGRMADPSDLAAVSSFLSRFIEANDFPALTRQTLYRLDLQGNSVQRLFLPDGEDIPTVRHVELCALKPPSSVEGSEWGIDYDERDAKKVKGYWIQSDGDDEPKYVPEEEVLHVRDDDDGSLPFGWPVFEPAIEPLLQAEELGSAGRARIRTQCKWSFIEKVANLTQAQADTYLASLTARPVRSATGDIPTSADIPTDVSAPGFGLIRRTSADLSPVNLGGGAADVMTAKQDALTEAAQAIGIAAWMFSGEVDEKYANAFAAMGPTLESLRYTQGLLSDALVTVKEPRRASLLWRAIRLAVKAGILSSAVLDTVVLVCTPRTLESRDRSGDIAADGQMVDRGAMSIPTFQERNGLDPDQEKRRGAKPPGEQPPGGPGGGGGGPDPVNPAGPGVSPIGMQMESWAVDARGWWADVDPPARCVSPVRMERWIAESRDLSKLQKKLIVDKNGHKRTVYVRMNKGETGKGGGKEGDGPAEEADKPSDPDKIRAESAAAVRKVLGAAVKSPADVAGLADHLSNLTAKQISQIKAEHKVRGGKLKGDLISRLIDRANDPEAHQPPTPKPPRLRSALLSAEIARRGGLDPSSASFLAHFSGVKDAMDRGLPLRMFKKGGGGFDTLAESLHREGYMNVPEGTDPAQFLADKLQANARHDLADVTDDYSKASKEWDAVQQEGRQAGMSQTDLDRIQKEYDDKIAGQTAADIFGDDGGDAAEPPKVDAEFGFGAPATPAPGPTGDKPAAADDPQAARVVSRAETGWSDKSKPLADRLDSLADLDTHYLDAPLAAGQLSGVGTNNEVFRRLLTRVTDFERGDKSSKMARTIVEKSADEVEQAGGKLVARLRELGQDKAADLYAKYIPEAVGEVRAAVAAAGEKVKAPSDSRESGDGQNKPAAKLTGKAAEDFKDYLPIARKQVDRETAPNRKRAALDSATEGLHPDATAAIVAELRADHPDLFDSLAKLAPHSRLRQAYETVSKGAK